MDRVFTIFNTLTLFLYLGNFLNFKGTLRPDLIESASHMASSRADAIKTHHNDSEMVRQLRHHGRVVEPLKGLLIYYLAAYWMLKHFD